MKQQSLENRILSKLSETGPMTARQIARLLRNHGEYQDILRTIDNLVEASVLRKEPAGYTFLLSVNDKFTQMEVSDGAN